MRGRISSLVSRATRTCNARRFSSALNAQLATDLDAMREGGTFKVERVITSTQTAEVKVHGTGGKVLNFCANNYLGLSDHPEVVDSAVDALRTHGFGVASVRFICGTQDIHKDLEKKIAAFHDKDDCILFPSCFDANAGIFETLLSKEDAVISDSLNHASIIDGIRLCKAARYRYNHMDMKDLEDKLKESQNQRHRMVVTDGVFSMDGDIAPLKEIRALCDKYDALLFIDECHATGFLGKTGKGTEELTGVQADIVNSTLGKALGGGTGGYTAASKEIITMMRQRARPYLFSNSVAPSVVGASLKVFDMLQRDTSLRDRLAANTKQFREGMAKVGYKLIGHPDHPIAPVMLGDAKLATQFAAKMLERGIYVIGFSFPVVPKEQARIRVQLSAAHTPEQIDRAIAAFKEVGEELNAIK